MIGGYAVSACDDDYTVGRSIYIQYSVQVSEAPFPETLDYSILGDQFPTFDTNLMLDDLTIGGVETGIVEYGILSDPDESSNWADGSPDGDWLGSDYYRATIRNVYTEPPQDFQIDFPYSSDFTQSGDTFWTTVYVDGSEWRDIVNAATYVFICTDPPGGGGGDGDPQVTIDDLPVPSSPDAAGARLHLQDLTLFDDGSVRDALASGAIQVADLLGEGLALVDEGFDTVVRPVLDVGLAATSEFEDELAAVAEVGNFAYFLFRGVDFEEDFNALTSQMLTWARELAALGEESAKDREARLKALDAALSGDGAPDAPLTYAERLELERERREIIDSLFERANTTGVRGVARYENGIPAEELAAAGFIAEEFLKGEVLTARIADGGKIDFEALWPTVLGGTLTLDGDRRIAIGTEGSDRIALAPETRGQVQLAGGDDWFTGGRKDDAIDGGAGNDTLSGGAGDDSLKGGAGADHLDGGEGIDTVVYAGSTGRTVIDLVRPERNNGDAAGDTYNSIENLIGSDRTDIIGGTATANQIWAGGRRDAVFGRGGDDEIYGEEGDDILNGGRGADLLDGGEGRDRVSYSQSNEGITVDLEFTSRNTGEAAGDILVSIEDLAGSFHDDTLAGDAGGTFIFGNDGDDEILGREGNDELFGGAGSDTIRGGQGDDLMRGGAARDTFHYDDGADVIGDWRKDAILFDSVLWGGGTKTPAELIGHASVVGGDTVFDFGGGNTLTVQNVTDLAGLEGFLGVFNGVHVTSADLVGEVTETPTGQELTDNGIISFTDGDRGDVHTVSAAFASTTHGARLGDLTAFISDAATGDGVGEVAWTYTVGNSAVAFLGNGETITERWMITLADGGGASVMRALEVTITGWQDMPAVSDFGTVFHGIGEYDSSGVSVSAAGDVNGDGIDDILIGAAWADPNGSIDAGESYVIFGRDTGLGTSFDLSSLDGRNGFAIRGIDADDISGISVSSAGDMNGDGLADILIGASGADPNGVDSAGESYVVFGRDTGFGASVDLSSLDGSTGFVINGIDELDFSGWPVASAGDVNDDGIDDILITADFADAEGVPGAGETYIVYGQANGFAASLDLFALNGTNGVVINGVDPGEASGSSVSSAGDVNGDGIDDILIGADESGDFLGDAAGETYVLFGRFGGLPAMVDLSSLNGSNGFVINGIDYEDMSGEAVSSAGDVNGDGIDDILIGAPRADRTGDDWAGEAYVVFGRSGGFPASLDLASLSGSDGFVVRGLDADDNLGSAISSAGDVNGDGIDDILIGAYGASPNGNPAAGATYLVFGRDSGFSPVFDLSTLDGDNGFVINGIDAFDFSGAPVSHAGDVNGDGIDDILIGASGGDPNGTAEAGEAYLLLGGADRLAAFDAADGLADGVLELSVL